ncbi:MAG: TetR/AcrR family transcriptional regulator [Acidimicrobiales bacterium]
MAVFGERGYTAATLDQIADAAGFSKGVVYSQFSSKADLFLHVLDRRIAERAAENQAAVERIDGDDLDAIVGELQRLMSRSDPAWRLAVTEFRIAAARDPALRARYEASHRRTVDRLASVLDQIYAKTRRVAPVPTGHLAATILALDVGIVVEDATTGSPLPAESLDVVLRRIVFGP